MYVFFYFVHCNGHLSVASFPTVKNHLKQILELNTMMVPIEAEKYLTVYNQYLRPEAKSSGFFDHFNRLEYNSHI